MLVAPKRAAVAGVFAALILGAQPATAHAAQQTGWRVAYMSPGFPRDELDDLAVTGPDDAWAVGSAPCCATDARQIMRWDGTQWRIIDPPPAPPDATYPGLNAVAAASPGDVWVFGIDANGLTFGHHWDGATWQTTVFGTDIRISDVAALGSGEVWFIGSKDTATGEQPIAGHYDGGRWTTLGLPGPATAISAVSPDAVWAIGHTGDGVTAMRWNGRSWRTETLPEPPVGAGVGVSPGDILAKGPNDVWASATLFKDEGIWPGAVLWHRSGRHWRRVRLNAPDDALQTLASDGRAGVWMVSAGTRTTAELLHYAHGRLTRQAAPVPSGQDADADVRAMSLIPGTRSLWGAGAVIVDDNNWAATVYRYDPA